MKRAFDLRLLIAAAPVVVIACRPAPRPAAPEPGAPDPCLVEAGSGAERDTLRVALEQPVLPAAAPVPRTDPERLVFRQLYETLVRVDCAGVIRQALAGSWRAEGGGAWTVTLAPGRRFWDGTPVTAPAVARAWAAARRPLVEARAVDDHTLRIAAAGAAAAMPAVLAHPELAVVKRIAESDWPVGTASHWVGGDVAGSRAYFIARPVPGAGKVPALAFVTIAGGDARDMLDTGLDLVVTRDPAVLEYAGRNPAFVTHPLPWDRVYVLLAPARLQPGTRGEFEPAFLEALATGAVRGEARPVPQPHWWDGVEGCIGSGGSAIGAAGPTPRIVYDAGDVAARELAERLVALGRSALGRVLPEELVGEGRGRPVAAGLSGDAFRAALRAGADLAYVVALPSAPLDPCGAVERLATAAPWLAQGGDPPALVPLVETRARVVVRRGTARLTVDWDGTVRVVPAEP